MQFEDFKYFEALKNDPNALQICCVAIFDNKINDEKLFLYLNILEIIISNNYLELSDAQKNDFQVFLLKFLDTFDKNRFVHLKFFVFNKFAQLFTSYFINDYLQNPSNLLQKLTLFVKSKFQSFDSPYAQTLVDVYLRILKAIYTEIADRSLPANQKEVPKNTQIKDKMRQNDNVAIMTCVYEIIEIYNVVKPVLACQALEIIGLYSSWVDINLTINEKSLVTYLNILTSEGMDITLKISTLTSFQEVLYKKMETMPKIQFLETMYIALSSNPTYKFSLNYNPSDPNNNSNPDFIAQKGKLLNTFGTLLIATWNKLTKTDEKNALAILNSIILPKIDTLMSYFESPSLPICLSVLEFAKDFLNFVVKPYQSSQSSKLNNNNNAEPINFDPLIQQILVRCLEKLTLPSNYDSGVELSKYQEFNVYRKDLKTLFETIGNINFNLVLQAVYHYVQTTLGHWPPSSIDNINDNPITFRQIEMTLTLFAYFADFYTSIKSQMLTANTTKSTDQTIDFKNATLLVDSMIKTFVASNIYTYPSPLTQSLYFEIVAKFERKIARDPDLAKSVLIAFQSEHGIKNPSPKMRSRCLQIFCRFIKNFKSNIPQSNSQSSTEPAKSANTSVSLEALVFIQGILEWTLSHQGESLPLSREDMNALYESYTILIIASTASLDKEKQKEAMEKLVYALTSNYQNKLQALKVETNLTLFEKAINSACDIINYLIRTTKAFSTNFTMQSMGLTQTYINVLNTLLASLDYFENLPIFMNSVDTKSNIQNSINNVNDQKPFYLNNNTTSDEQKAEKTNQVKYALYSAIRQFFHVMVVCLDCDIIPFIGPAFEIFFRFRDRKIIADLIPLFNQLTTKFKDNSTELVNRLFFPLVRIIFDLLSTNSNTQRIANQINGTQKTDKSLPTLSEIDPHEIRERVLLQRSYFSLLSHLFAQNGILKMLLDQGDENNQIIVQSIIQGVSDSTDPMVQKTCFSLLRKIVDTTMNPTNGPTSSFSVQFNECLYNLIFPACFSAPLKPSFDLKDAQTIQALNECALLLQLIHRKGGTEFETILLTRIFPSLNFTDENAAYAFTMALKEDTKTFKTYLKSFYTKLKLS